MPQNPSNPFSSQRVVGISPSSLSSPTAWPRNAEMLSPPSVTCSLVVGVLPWQLGNVGLNLPGRGKPRTRLAFLGQVVLTTGLQHKWWEAPPFPLVTAFFDGSKMKLALLSPLKTCSGEAWGLLIPAILSCSTDLGTSTSRFLSWPLTGGLWGDFSKALNALHILIWDPNAEFGVHSGHMCPTVRYCHELSHLE